MSLNSKTRRRWFGGVCLLTALVMLAVGNKSPGGRLDGIPFLLYWLGCFVLAMLALLTAILDARAVRQEAIEAQRELLEEAMESIKAKKANGEKPNQTD